jgi:hypothetical protein
MTKELFVGPFVHSLSLEELEIGENGVIGVEDGKIVFVEKNVKDLEAVKKTHHFEEAKVVLSDSNDYGLTIGRQPRYQEVNSLFLDSLIVIS